MVKSQSSKTRIVITGASGVGKTTLVEALAPLLCLPIIPELARQMCVDMGYAKIGSIPDQIDFKKQVLQKQIEEENRLGSFVSDRSTIDCWALWQRWNINDAMTYDTEAYYEQARTQAASGYTHIIYIPPMFACPEDGFRWTEPDYQKQIDRNVRMTLYEWNLLDKTLTIEDQDNDKRLKQVVDWLEKQ
jgi:predicted ATPase